MKQYKNKILTLLSLIGAFIVGFMAYHSTSPVLGSSNSVRDSFDQITLQTSTVITASGTLAILDSNANRVYVSIVDSGSNGVSCFPNSTTTGLTYGGGWWLAGNGGAITFDGVAIYTGKISCISGTSSTTIGIVER